MVRLVFRPYTQIWRSICTSEPLRASTRVSSGLTLFRHSSPSFGSQQIRSYSNLSKNLSRSVDDAPPSQTRALTSAGRTCLYFHCASRVCHPKTCVYARLLGPCFKTGRLKPFCQHLKRVCDVSKLNRTPELTALRVVQQIQAPQAQLAQPNGTRCKTVFVFLGLSPGRAHGLNTSRSLLPSRMPYPAQETDVDLPRWSSAHPRHPSLQTRRLRCQSP